MKTFIELGACDFENLIPLLMAGWRGYFIEPIPRYMISLKNEIQNQNLEENAIFDQCAISNIDGEIEMIVVSNPSEQWQRGISHVKANGNKDFSSDLISLNDFDSESIIVRSMTLNQFLIKHDIKEIDVCKIDVEGHELVILENYDWCIKPKYLKIEHKFVNDLKLVNLLNEKGYFVWQEHDDLYAILK